ncbi:ATP-binding protein [Limnobacter humi]|uniref:histidine kinase n=1 Tax=Limnobacter humi TaxID=1778671 RepID=A0ABT1WFA8_9BURK|nr:ATP-binding protein [Limnobacter humi]MCQ8895583.1 ATP-binding protein [Limnobacter humi]
MNPWLENTRWLRYTLMILAGLGGVFLFVLASASSNTDFFESNYPLLISLNGMIAVGMFSILMVLVVRMVRRYRAGVFGSRLMLRMSLSFALMGLIPGLLMYVVSVQFLAKSIDSWFDVRVDGALESGLNLGQTALDSLVNELSQKGQSISLELSRATPSQQLLELSRLRDAANVQELTLLTETAQVIGSSGGSLDNLLPSLPAPSMLRQALMTRPFQQIEPDPSDPDTRLIMRVVVPIAPPLTSFDLGQRYVQILQPVPLSLSQRANAVQSVYRDYQELQLSRSGLRKIYGITLTLALLLTVFVSVAAAFWLSTRLSAPLLWLAEGTKALASGNFKTMQPVNADDELRELTESFNTMTQQLSEAQRRLQANQAQLAANNDFLQSLLGSLSAGVLVLDHKLRLKMYNEGALRIFDRALSDNIGKPLDDMDGLKGFAMAVRASVADNPGDNLDDGGIWQKQLEIPRAFDSQSSKSILVRGSRLPGEKGGYVLVCDDITALISAQRTVAWGEVARRLAHEIKNPLTPIQLSAERLQMKLADKLVEPESGILERATRTIVNQVESLKKLVNDFRDYARLPPADLKPLDLNELVADVLALYDIHVELGVTADSTLIPKLTKNLPGVAGDSSQLRQVIHNLLQNALDACGESETPRIEIRTEGVKSPEGEQHGLVGVKLVVADNGPGFKADVLDKAFEPYITTKTKGTGLGLAIVRKIADEHKARIAIRNRVDAQGHVYGAAVEITFPVLNGTEKPIEHTQAA